MNINIRLDITPDSARRLAGLGVTLLVLGGAAAAYAGVPVTFVSQQKLTAAQLNENFADLDGRLTTLNAALAGKGDKGTIPIITPWQSYSPVLTTKQGANVENQTSTGYFRRVGDTLEARFFTLFTGAPNSGSPWWQWGLPDGLKIDLLKVGPIAYLSVGHGSASSASAEQGLLDAYVRSAQTVTAGGSELPYVTDTMPVVFDGGAVITLDIKVPIEGWSVTE